MLRFEMQAYKRFLCEIFQIANFDDLDGCQRMRLAFSWPTSLNMKSLENMRPIE